MVDGGGGGGSNQLGVGLKVSVKGKGDQSELGPARDYPLHIAIGPLRDHKGLTGTMEKDLNTPDLIDMIHSRGRHGANQRLTESLTFRLCESESIDPEGWGEAQPSRMFRFPWW